VRLMPIAPLHFMPIMKNIQSIASSICSAGLAIITLTYPNAVLAQDEQGAPPPPLPAEPSSQAPEKPPGQDAWWGRLELGSKLGLSLANFVGADATSELVEYAHKPSITLGGLVSIRVWRWLAVQTEVLYVSKGRDVVVEGTVTDTFDGDYIEFPLLARIMFPLGEQVAPYLLAGPTFGILRSFTLEDHEAGSVDDRTDLAKSVDLSLLGGIGVKVALTNEHALMIEGRYNRSLATLVKDETEDLKNSVFAFTLGYQYSFFTAFP
jgi:Outer membrane protein beta-barrel domain